MKILIVFFLLVAVIFSQPSISGITGTLDHKSTMTITGTNFSAKPTAAPRVWDWCDNESTSDMDTYFPGDRWPKNCEGYGGTPGETPYLVDYRTTFHGFSTMPHANATKFICSASTTCENVSGGINWWQTTFTNNLFTIDNWNADTLFIMYYYRMSSTYSKSTDEMGGPNVKELSANDSPGGYLAGPDNYKGWCGIPMETYPADAYERGVGGSCSEVNRIYTPNPMGDWIHLEWLWDATSIGDFFWSNDDSCGGGDQYGYPIDRAETPSSITVGGFVRWPMENTTGNYRYWANVYADDSFARVIIGDNATWTSCGIREPQIPSAWTTTSITATTNLGAFSSGDTAYVFIWDVSNTANATGYQVVLGEGSQPTPSNDKALKIIDITN